MAQALQQFGMQVSEPAEVPARLSQDHRSRINSTYDVKWSIIGIRSDAVAVSLLYYGGAYVRADVALYFRSNDSVMIPGAFRRLEWQGTSGEETGAVVLFEGFPDDALGRRITECSVGTRLENLSGTSGLEMWRYLWK